MRAGEEIRQPVSARGGGVRRRGIARAHDVEPGFRIVRAGYPGMPTPVNCRVQVLPRVEARVARFLRRGVPLPLQIAGLRIERLQEPGHVEVVARSDQDVVVDDDRRHRVEVLLLETGQLPGPALLAGARVERDQVVVGRHEKQIVVPHPDATVSDVRPPARLPHVVPHFPPGAAVDRPGVVRCRHIQHTIDLEDRPFDLRRTVPDKVTDAAHDQRDQWRAGAVGQSPGPCEREVPDVGLIDLGEGAVASARVIAVIGGPRLTEWLVRACRAGSALRVHRQRRDQQGRRKQQDPHRRSLSDARYAVTLWMSLSV